MAKARHKGRRQGSRNKGYFFRSGRGWFTKNGTHFIPLTNAAGERLRNRSDGELADLAYSHFKVAAKQNPTAPLSQSDNITVLEVCQAYLSKVIEEKGKNRTYELRARILFDFCFGLPPRFRAKDGKPGRKATKADKIHDGFGSLTVGELKKVHIDRWLQAHSEWDGCKRTQIQGVKRALNYAADAELISRNPIKGYKTPKANARATYITPEQEAAIYNHARPAFALAVKVLIATGARPGCEFANLTAHHITDYGDKMEWTFQPHESKTHTLRTVYISDPEIIAIIRQQVQSHPTGSIFRGSADKRWTIQNLSQRFRTIKKSLAKRGIKLDDDACIYSTRHTRAKRLLEGTATGRPVSIQTVATLLGNSVDVCLKHYGNWNKAAKEHIWAALA